MRFTRRWISWTAPVLLLSSLLLGCRPKAPEQAAASEQVLLPGVEEIKPPRPAPDFEAPGLDGAPFRLSAHRGSVILLNFWATWCAPCRTEIPDLVALQRELGDRGLLVVGVSTDEEGAEVVAPFAANFKINYPVVLDDGSVSEAYGGIWALPTTVVIDRAGRIRYEIIGIFPTEEMRPRLEALLDESAS
ncbi:alkyl hydroperoxide reductase/ Thiol specific antioxidant/ Mal allergen [Rhodothermus marinus SG0.5JP17-172]|jgi:peroxiredoxin|uniref:TlpA disulfide reductase family protein n=1 Tax=Rhodothermus marinus TaxID=29549 RepID=UPI000223D8AF|nr:TlpA disulfide reductase family protein [Rhodothermus marinus]AEN72897.1 alkyl hydroperoxide reductase/ Thiol specific antioxidant/ Mal allergen [Rhodothermus marinus SG0.5JP17-172]MBO2491630.1 TlpA family protein disulfide reductase [Rhodothermus marinus]